MRVLGLASLVLAVGLVASAKAAPLDIKQVPAGATWVVHVDVDAIRASAVVQKAYAQCVEKHKDAVEKGLAKARQHLGMDPVKDLHGITLYGPKLGEHKGVMIVWADVDQKVLTEKFDKVPEHKMTPYGKYQVGSVTHKGKMGQHTVAGAFWKPGATVVASSVEEVEAALDTLDGKKPALEARGLLAHPPAGATLVARVTGIADAKLPCKSPLPKQIESFRLAMGENQGQSFLSVKVTTKTPETAQQIEKIVEGGKALAGLRHMGDAAASKIIDQFKVSVSDKTVAVEFKAPATDVWDHVQKVIKDIKEMHHHQGKKPGGKPAPDKK
ncbi:MAG: hypothetical protein ABSG86_28360 [Thermoguttaceae bacterium]|jgi:hypothetical protein